MNIEGIYSVALLLLIVAVADFVIMAREHFAATVGFVAYGLLIALAWMGLSAPDVALTEAAVGGGVTGALLLGACAGLRGANDPDERPRLIERGAALVLSVGITAALIGVMLLLPEPAPTLAPSAKESLGSTGLANAVTAVLMVDRALDTMLEKVVLLLALVAVWSLAADRFWEDVPPSGFLRSQADH